MAKDRAKRMTTIGGMKHRATSRIGAARSAAVRVTLEARTRVWRARASWRCALLLLALLASDAPRAQDAPVVAEADGIAAEMAIEPAAVLLRWRILRPGTSEITDIVATLNGEPMGTPQVQAYPYEGSRTVILLLVDISGPARAEQIQQDKVFAFEIAGRSEPHHETLVAVYDQRPRLFTPGTRALNILGQNILNEPASEAAPDLNTSLASAMETIARQPADRRGIFILTDGYSAEPISVDELAALASEKGVSLSFLLSASDRSSDRDTIAALVARTGGMIVDPAHRAAFAESPFDLIDSGATARFAVPEARPRYFWEPDREFRIAIRYGSDELVLSAERQLPVAGVAATASHVVLTYPAAVAGAGAGSLALFGGLIALLVRRRRSAEPAAEADPAAPLAMLQDIGSAASFPIRATSVRLGRAADNDVVLPDQSISRLHAVLTQEPDGRFSVENRSSTNGTQVNHRFVDKTMLTTGDLITVGTTTLRFTVGHSLRAEASGEPPGEPPQPTSPAS